MSSSRNQRLTRLAVSMPPAVMLATCWLCGAGVVLGQTPQSPKAKSPTEASNAASAQSDSTAHDEQALEFETPGSSRP